MEIRTCYDEYKSTFLDDGRWLPSDPQNEDEVKIAYDKISNFIERSFILLTRSIISGEYIEAPNINNALSNFIDEVYPLELNPSSDMGTGDNLTKLRTEFDVLNSSLFNALRFYQLFISTSKNKFTPTPINEQYGVFRVVEEVKNNALSLFVNISIPLCKYDYFLPVSTKDFQNLLSIRNNIKELIGGSSSREMRKIYSLLLFKCHFIIRRIKKTRFDNEINFNRETINPAILDIGDYKSFISEDVKTKEQLLENIKSSSPEVRSFVFLMKYYKQSLENEDEIALMDYLLERYIEVYDEFRDSVFRNNDEFKTQYDQFSLDSILNFLHNCRFSAFTQKCKPNLKCIKQKLRKIEDVQSITRVRNFHPYEKAIEAVILCIKTHIQENDFDEKLLNDKIDELERLIKSFDDALKWSEFHKFFPFQLPFDESLVYSEEYDLKLFVPSAFAKNIDYQELKEELASFRKERDNLIFLLDLSKERKEIERIKENIKNTDKKAIDLIAIFTASITFLFGVVNIFVVNNDISLGQLITNTMGLGIVLALFMCMYLLISPILIQRIEWKRFLKTGRFWFGLVGLIIYVVTLLVFLENQNTPSCNSKIQDKNDIMIDNMRPDSISNIPMIKAAQ